jgi:glucose-1-phosphatase
LADTFATMPHRVDTAQLDTLFLDLGGVLLNVDYERTAQAFSAQGVSDFQAQFSKAKQSPLFDQFETGHLSPQEFRAQIRSVLGAHLTDTIIDRCWNAMLGDLPPERIVLLEELRMRYRVFLLSNTNVVHVAAFQKSIQERNGIRDLRQEFDGVFLSCEVGLRKPDHAIFQHALRVALAQPERTLFIDDSIQHVRGAEQVGIHAYHLDLTAKEDLHSMVQRLGLLA